MKFDNTIKAIKEAFYETNGFWYTLALIIAVVLLVILGISTVTSILLGAWWLMWQLWMFVMPEIASGMPQGFQTPKYWTFVACCIMLVWVRGFIRNTFIRKNTNEN